MRRFVFTLTLAVLPCGAAAQPASGQTGGVLQSYARARALLDSAIVAHGGLEALGSATRFVARMEGQDFWRNQSRRVEPPYDAEPWTGTLMLDLPRARYVWTATSAFPGGFRNANRTVIDGPRGFNANLRQQTYFNVPNRAVWTQRQNLFRLPHLVLLSALEDAATLRWIGDVTVDGARSTALTVATPQGAQLTLGFEPSTRLLRSISTLSADPLAGDVENVVVFTDYRRIGRVMMPGRRVSRVAGETLTDIRYTALDFDASIPDSLVAPPPGFTELRPPQQTPAVQQLAPDVWDIRGAGYHSLVVAFTDHVFVFEAPGGGGSSEVIARVKETVPGKPIRYVAPTHHHDDHAGGMRDYVAEGATIITTPGNKSYFERMAAARRTIAPDALSRQPRPARVEVIAGKKRVVTDGRRTVELIDIGPSPHANEMLVAWLPSEGILFQGDLLNVPVDAGVTAATANATTVHFADWIKRSGLNVRVLAGVHMSPATMAQLEEALAKASP